MRVSLKRRLLHDKMDGMKAKQEKETHENYHVGGVKVLSCRYCRQNYVDFGKMKGRKGR
jgi:hypothetical protein